MSATRGRTGIGVRYLRTTFLPGDETILHVFEAMSREGRPTPRAKPRLPFVGRTGSECSPSMRTMTSLTLVPSRPASAPAHA